MLAVGAGDRGAAEMDGQRLRLLGSDDPGQSPTVGVLADMPGGRPRELPVAGDGAGLRHARQAKVSGVGQHGGQDYATVPGRQAGPQMGERVGDPGPLGDLVEKVGDPHPRQEGIDPVGQPLGLLRGFRGQRRDLQGIAGETDVGQPVLAGLVGNLSRSRVARSALRSRR